MCIDLRPLRAADAPTLSAWATDPVQCAHAGWTLSATTDEAIGWWEDLIVEPPPGLLRLGAWRGAELVGYVDLLGDAPDVRELGYCIGPSARWGQGLGTNAAAAGLRHGFVVLGLRRIWAEALDADPASVRTLRRIGMQESGWGGEDVHLGRPSRYRQFSIDRTEWEPLSAR